MLETHEENWRRTDPNDFFLPEEECLNFAGNPVEQTKGNAMLPWKVSFFHQDDLLSFRNLMVQSIGSSAWDVLESQQERLVLVQINSGLVRIFLGSSVSQAVQLQSSPWEPSSVIPNSQTGFELSKRLKQCSPHEFVLSLSHSSEKPLLVVCNELDPNFAQSYSKVRIDVGVNVQADLLWLDKGSSFAMHQCQIDLAANTHLNCVSFFQNENASNVLLERKVNLKKEAVFLDTQFFCVQQGNVRMSSCVNLEGIGAQSRSANVAILKGGKLDCEPVQHHRAPKGISHLKSKMILSARARGVFQGLIKVDQTAPHSFASQENKNLLQSPLARVDAIPRLEVSLSDVSCKHGSATAELDEKQIYYLCSRGFSVEQAKRILMQSFAAEALAQFDFSGEHMAVFQNLTEVLLDQVSL